MQKDKVNVIFIVIDTLRADHLGCYGYFRKTSPTIDSLAEEGVLFENSYASGIPTGPGFTSLITGLFPIHHRFYFTPVGSPNMVDFDDDIPTLAEIIWENGGYTTAAFDNLINFRSHMDQFVRGFEYYINVTRTPVWRQHWIKGETVNERLIPWIKEHAKENFFTFIHYWDPHTPYNQPEKYRGIFQHKKGDLSDLKVCQAKAGYSYVPGWGKVDELWEEDKERKPEYGFSEGERTLDLYDGEIRYVDDLIGQILDVLKRTKIINKTVVIITSDHGEQLGQHGMYGHLASPHESLILVPLIFWQPNILPEGKRIKGLVQHVDTMASILDIMGITKKPKLDGNSLLPVIEGRKKTRDSIVIEQTIEYEQERAILEDGWKYIRHINGNEQLYNIKDDPVEAINLEDKEGKKCSEMKRELEKWVYDNIGYSPDPMIEAMKMADEARRGKCGFFHW